MKPILKEQEQIYSEAHSKELLNIQVAYNKELQALNDKYAKKRADLQVKYLKIDQMAQQQAAQKAAAAKAAETNVPSKPKGEVDTAGNAPAEPAKVESYSDILKVREKLNETTFDITGVESEALQDLKDYMDADNIPYIEDEEQTTLDFDKNDLDDEWFERLEEIGLKDIGQDIKIDDILDVEDDEESEEDWEQEEREQERTETNAQNDMDLKDVHDQIDEQKVFYVKVNDDGQEFIGKIYKLFDEGDWRAKVIDGTSKTFEKLNYDPDFDEFDVIAFLRENYDDAELIDKEEFNNHVESPEEEPKIKEGHRIPTFEQFLNETLKFSDGEEFDTSGSLRTEERHDGWYVIGEGKLIPVKSEIDGLNVINQLNKEKDS